MRQRSSRGGFEIPERERLVVPGRELRGPEGWTEIFGRCAPLVVELGFGKDPFLLDRAAERPDQDHVGVERDPARVALFLDRAAARGLGNVRALATSAEIALGYCFDDGRVAELHVYFPDPWPKVRHALNRMIRPWFAAEAARVLAPGGAVRLATDDEAYAAQMVEVMRAAGFVESRTAAESEHGHRTRFERLWREKGRRIHHLGFLPPALVGS